MTEIESVIYWFLTAIDAFTGSSEIHLRMRSGSGHAYSCGVHIQVGPAVRCSCRGLQSLQARWSSEFTKLSRHQFSI